MTALCPLEHAPDEEGNPTQRNAAPGMILCWSHRNRMEREIAQLPDLYDDLVLRLHPSGPTLKPYTTHDAGGTATVNPKTGEEESETYINGRVADLRDLIWAGLSALARVVVEDRGVHPPEDSHPRVVAPWLARHLDWICAQPFADDEALNLHNLASNGRKLAYPSGRRRVQIGACPKCCDGGLFAVVARADELLPAEIRCDSCGYVIPPRLWRALRKTLTGLDVESVLTVAQACDLYGLPDSTLYRWISEGRITDVGEGQARVRATELEARLAEIGVLRDSA